MFRTLTLPQAVYLAATYPIVITQSAAGNVFIRAAAFGFWYVADQRRVTIADVPALHARAERLRASDVLQVAELVPPLPPGFAQYQGGGPEWPGEIVAFADAGEFIVVAPPLGHTRAFLGLTAAQVAPLEHGDSVGHPFRLPLATFAITGKDGPR